MTSTYGQFCPVSKAAEVICERWTPLIVRELLVGSSRFNEIRRGLPTCSTALLSQRLKSLERAGVIERSDDESGPTYQLTPAGWELFPLIQGLGEWGQRWVRSEYQEDDLDPGLLLWDVRRYLSPSLATDRVVVLFQFPTAAPKRRRYWVVADDQIDLCFTDPGWPVDATIEADVRALTRVWMGDTTFLSALRAEEIRIDAPTALKRRIPDWFGQHPVLAQVPAAR
jgi:DNA-binding HxlR family transcriptional regulator